MSTSKIINKNTCPGCGGPGQKLGAEDCDYNCVNGFCDVRTFRPRKKSATTDNKPRTTSKGA